MRSIMQRDGGLSAAYGCLQVIHDDARPLPLQGQQHCLRRGVRRHQGITNGVETLKTWGDILSRKWVASRHENVPPGCTVYRVRRTDG
jgi:hypothetical protein